MSNRTAHHAEYPQHHAHDHHRAQARRTGPAKAPAQPARQGDYTIAHAGKQFRIGPVVFWIVVGTVTVLGAWSAATATYFAFRDDVLTKLIARQAEMQYAYEDRISELRAKVDRSTSRQMLDQEQFDQKLAEVTRRQAVLENRAAMLSAIPDNLATGSIGKPPASSGTPKPSPINTTVTPTAPPDRQARLGTRILNAVMPGHFAKIQGVDTVITKLQASLDQVESKQLSTLSVAEETMNAKVNRMRGVVSELGLNMAQLEAAAPRAPMGGPYVPVKLTADAGPFERQLVRTYTTRAQLDKLNRTMALVPYRKPVVGEIEYTSTFGVRSDPFLGRPAMHTGLDFRAATGDPIRATANGRVTSAAYAGGYGKMIELDHGNGLATRYGHLSEINVRVGDVVKIGQVIGLAGSTGRSTGSHLHYETRIEGEAVDPQKFLRAGARLGAG
ncbi:peptidoglycan DD-metalloendopeptidase family protein [Tardiphaga sp. vice352]|uniref:peptidoglycan DD-metalloendopeptidase family protein n=1 Tax=unclassified Tardiphaga TaxID=2631404 RepID=UPI001164343B|nr:MULTISPECIES: peptidoglycan DD-metalloendopeptidase family protein [unclassified Tardiphaga]QDM17119.1 peptidoglycan DD-metalloendopeptidase family protein [Tardiphaga sp. vice278]QDM22098.1 peptidoglycan DD-metalloendopeptidase family protein [Tardiphaga sp. vice154]QDM27353.1 peptidoglycan DD-metalloendopeptidase family protein [Tardiphaga sp. vice304]QDM32479.1 peptidoglycan DD-metalloendopeptidase family protein [Tardiphaga sp. vice352]